MAIEGLKGTYGIPLIKNERQMDPDKKKKKHRDGKKEGKKEEGKKNSDRKIDIRI